MANREDQLAWEARQRPRAGAAAIVAGLLAPIAMLWLRLALQDVPHVGILDSLNQALEPGPIGDKPSLLTPVFQYYSDHALVFVGTSLLQAISMLALAWAVTFLAVCTRARRPELPRYIVYVALVGAVLLAVSSILGGIGRALAFNDFLDSDRTIEAARDIGGQPLLATSTLIGELAPLLLAAGLLLVSLNAMRVGLLTRFLGILGMISGGLTIFSQFFLFAPFVEAFWLLALGIVYLNLGRAGAPPAWRTGQAEPWPSQRDVAAQRQAARQGANENAPQPQGEEQPVPAGRPHPSSKKRKRKRRG